MSILADHGLVGGFIFFTLILASVRQGIRISKNISLDKDLRLISLGAACALVGVMTASQFSNSKVMEISIWMIAFITIILNISRHDKLDD
jgi:hypothetical protein